MDAKFIRISPILSTTNVVRDIAWWEEKAGFKKVFVGENLPNGKVGYGAVERQGICLHLQYHSNYPGDRVERSAIRIEVQNIQPLFEEMVSRGTVKPDAFREKTDWGTREFGFYDLPGNAIFFFESLV